MSHDYEGGLLESERRSAMPWLYEDSTSSLKKKAYVRKTVDEFDVEMHTSEGWEVVTCETTKKEALARTKEYRENQPGAYRIVKRRVKRDQL